MLNQLQELEKTLNKEISRKKINDKSTKYNDIKEKNLEDIHSELKIVVLDKFLEKIQNQSNLIINQKKEIEKIKGNFEKIIKKNNKQADLSIDSIIKKENDINDLIPSLDASALANISTDQILYHNKNKILKNITTRICKNNKFVNQEANGDGSELINQDDQEAFHKKLNFEKIVKDVDSSINFQRINSLESVSKINETEGSIKNVSKKENVKISQSPIRNSNIEIEKELKKLENNESKRKNFNTKSFKQVPTRKNAENIKKNSEDNLRNISTEIKKNHIEKIKKQDSSRNISLINENKSRSVSKTSKIGRSVSPSLSSMKQQNFNKEKKSIPSRDFGKFINTNKKLDKSSLKVTVTEKIHVRDNSFSAISKVIPKNKRIDSVEKKTSVTPSTKLSKQNSSKKLNINTIKPIPKLIKESTNNDEITNNSILNNSIEVGLSKSKNIKSNISNGRIDISNQSEKIGNIGYSERMLNKYYQFLDTINKKYDINENETKTNKKKDKSPDLSNNLIFTIKEEYPTKNESYTSLKRDDKDQLDNNYNRLK